MKVKLRLTMCQACGQWSNSCTEYNGERLCPECKQFEIEHQAEREQERIEREKNMIVFDTLGSLPL